MELTSSQQETIRYQFESYCKSVLRNAKNSLVGKIQHIAEYETTFTELSQREMEQLFLLDEYPVEYFHFNVGGEDVTIKDENLYRALSKLPPQKRDIVLLAHYLGKSDVQIAKTLNMIRRTVQYQRKTSLAKLNKWMGGSELE